MKLSSAKLVVAGVALGLALAVVGVMIHHRMRAAAVAAMLKAEREADLQSRLEAAE